MNIRGTIECVQRDARSGDNSETSKLTNYLYKCIIIHRRGVNCTDCIVDKSSLKEILYIGTI